MATLHPTCVGHDKERLVSNPWLKKNPFLSMWLSGANAVAGAAKGQMVAEMNRQAKAGSAAIAKEFAAAAVSPAKPVKRPARARKPR